jgi:CheY-like chemotaxis protein
MVAAPQRAPAPTDTILIADDEPAVLMTTAAVLRHHGYKTVLARDGVEAVALFRAEPTRFVAVLLDLTMPGFDGAEVLRSIRAINPAVRVLVMSGYSERDVLNRLNGQENVSVLRKPFTQDVLVKQVNEVIAREAGASSA